MEKFSTLILISNSVRKYLKMVPMEFVNQTKIRKVGIFQNLQKINNKIPFLSQIIQDTLAVKIICLPAVSAILKVS